MVMAKEYLSLHGAEKLMIENFIHVFRVKVFALNCKISAN